MSTPTTRTTPNPTAVLSAATPPAGHLPRPRIRRLPTGRRDHVGLSTPDEG
ncbi:MAG TPA: hypothetical protein VHV82_22905 [Sporichthyaceae bacterium]|jgi:hypothetical protein|nr:hypothetical protein [Sporichthyaceae bacterium]